MGDLQGLRVLHYTFSLFHCPCLSSLFTKTDDFLFFLLMNHSYRSCDTFLWLREVSFWFVGMLQSVIKAGVKIQSVDSNWRRCHSNFSQCPHTWNDIHHRRSCGIFLKFHSVMSCSGFVQPMIVLLGTCQHPQFVAGVIPWPLPIVWSKYHSRPTLDLRCLI